LSAPFNPGCEALKPIGPETALSVRLNWKINLSAGQSNPDIIFSGLTGNLVLFFFVF